MKDFLRGMRDGIPIFLGYISVAFSFGIMAVGMGLSVFETTIISFTNLTSAGQFAGIAIISRGAGLIEMAITQLVINARYFLMSVSLSQKYDEKTKTISRLGAAFFVTDEIFALAASRKEILTAAYMAGMGVISSAGWSGGTLLGAAAGNFLPTEITNAFSIALYGMFIALFIPAAKKSMPVAFVVFIAIAVSCALKYIIFADKISYGFSIIIATITASVIGALMFPIADEEDEDKTKTGV